MTTTPVDELAAFLKAHLDRRSDLIDRILAEPAFTTQRLRHAALYDVAQRVRATDDPEFRPDWVPE